MRKSRCDSTDAFVIPGADVDSSASSGGDSSSGSPKRNGATRSLDHAGDRLQLGDGLEPALRLARLRRLVAEAVDERLHVLALRVLLRARGLAARASRSARVRSNVS